MNHTEAAQYIKATLTAFGPGEAISMTKETWAKLRGAIKTLAQSRSDEEQPPQQEPVAWMWKDGTVTTDPDRADGTWTPLYTSPPASKPWVGLTDDEIDECYYWKDRQWTTDELVRHVEAKLREKNAPQQSKEDA